MNKQVDVWPGKLIKVTKKGEISEMSAEKTTIRGDIYTRRCFIDVEHYCAMIHHSMTVQSGDLTRRNPILNSWFFNLHLRYIYILFPSWMTAKPEKDFLILETEATPSAGVFRLVSVFDAQYPLNTFMALFIRYCLWSPTDLSLP